MDFSFTEEQETNSKLARELFERRATPERLTELGSGETRYDAALWQELAAVDLLGTALPESVGGNGGGFVELGVLLSEVGWSVAPVPVYATLSWAPTRSRGMEVPNNSSVTCPESLRENVSLPRDLPSPAAPIPCCQPPKPGATARIGAWTEPRSWYRPPSWPTRC
jgi:hypothetical protein